MPKPDLSVTINALIDKIIAHLPPKLQAKVKNWTAQQRQTAFIAGAGVTIFLFLWMVFSALFSNGTAELDRSAFGQQHAEQGVTTAIAKPVQSFPAPEIAPEQIIDDKKPKIVVNLTSAQEEQIIRLRNNVDHQYKDVLSFPLDETKMISFAQAASRIDKINMKWDTLIAGTPDERLALEYLSNTELEIKTLLKESVGITLNEYNEIYNLSVRDKKFNDIANAYKNLVTQGIWGPLTPVTRTQHKQSNPALRFPIAPAANNTTAIPQATKDINPAAPAAPGTAPVPAGLPKPPYSPPPAR